MHRVRRGVGFFATFLAAWYALDRLVTSPPRPISAATALAAAAGILAVGQVIAFGVPVRQVPASIGLGRPVPRALLVAAVVGALVPVTLVAGAKGPRRRP